MFCDGNCKKGNKKCGLLTEIIIENKKDGSVKNEEMCVFQASLHSLLRGEGQRDGLHAAENSTRNETVSKVLALQHAVEQDMYMQHRVVQELVEMKSKDIKEITSG